jgi:GT2 family glycosyltransferase
MNHHFRIGILSYNHPEITARVIQSCLRVSPETPITVLHNGSELRWIKQLQNQFPEIDHLILTPNRGFTGGANALMEAVLQNSEWCLFLTNDVQLLEVQVPKEIGLVTPLIYRRKIGIIDSMGALFDPTRGHLEHCRTLEAFQNPKKEQRPYIPGTAFWIHRRLFQNIGGFDLSLGTYWEDVDYSQKVCLGGEKLLFCEQTKLVHSVGKTCHKLKRYTAYLFFRNKYYVSLRYIKNPLKRGAFKIRYWCQWALSITKALMNGDSEVLNFKLQIAKDLLFQPKILDNNPTFIQSRIEN